MNGSLSLNAWRRWIVVGVFGFSSSLNYLDRQLLSAVAPALKKSLSLSNAEYGLLLSGFSLSYMVASPFAGWFLDRIGLRRGAALAVAVWSTCGLVTGYMMSFTGLLLMRVGLGFSEAAGIPASSKASSTYLKPAELGIGNAIQSIDITLGAIVAPLIVAALSPAFGWRMAFVVCGVAGLLWIPLWWATSQMALPVEKTRNPLPVSKVLVDKRLWAIVGASTLVMAVHSLWLNWTTIYLVDQYHLTPDDANRYFAWIPPVFASVGGLLGGVVAFRRINAGQEPVQARASVCLMAVPLVATTALLPFSPSALLGVAGISISFLGAMAMLINLHVIPLDFFGSDRAAFATSILTGTYGLMQGVLSPAIGFMVDWVGFNSVSVLIAFLSITGALLAFITCRQHRKR